MTGGDILILKVNFGRGLLMCIQIQSNKKNNNTYLEKVSKNQRGREQETLYLFLYLAFIMFCFLNGGTRPIITSNPNIIARSIVCPVKFSLSTKKKQQQQQQKQQTKTKTKNKRTNN